MAIGSSAQIAIAGYTGKTAAFNVPSYQIDAANLATWLTGWGDLKTALSPLLAGTMQKELVRLYDTDLGNAIPTDKNAIRGNKLMLRFEGDTNGQVYRRTIPAVDLDAFTYATGPQGFTRFVVLNDSGVMAAFVSAFEAIARSPEDDAETVTVVSAEVITVDS